MNVLVYSGPEVLQSSLPRTLATLKSVLLSNYAVQTISPSSLASHPWASSCALLVLPSCRKHALPTAQMARAIQSYVESGGALLALSAALRHASRTPGDEVIALRLGSSGEYMQIASTVPADASSIELRPLLLADGPLVSHAPHYPPTPDAEIFPKIAGLQLLATSSGNTPSQDPTLAGALTRAGGGPVAVWTLPLEHPGTDIPGLSAPDAAAADTARRALVRATLAALGLAVPAAADGRAAPTRPGSQALVGAPRTPGIVSRIADALALPSEAPAPGSPLRVLEDAHDTFRFLPASVGLARPPTDESADPDPDAREPREVVVYRDGTLPDADATPLFDLRTYFGALAEARGARKAEPWGMGEALLYGEAVTSTQTLLDQNPAFLSALPVPILALASFQLAGRGRGANAWLSPAGCLQFSLLLRVRTSALPASRLVFAQYLFALAVAEACRAPGVLGVTGDAVRLKWPNDLYVVRGAEKRKIGGILVNTSFRRDEVDVIIGCGLNVHTAPPLASLAELLPPSAREALKMENAAAAIVATFERMWDEFVSERGDFTPFMDLYLERWLHSDQPVTLTTVTPHRRVRIVGITPEHGLLRTVPEQLDGGRVEFIDLQPDGNSFDLMAGLIKTKGS